MTTQHRYLPEPVTVTEDEEMAILNHEARTALCILLMTTEALQFELFGALSTAQTEALSKIHENATYLQALLDSILQHAQGEPVEDLVG